MIKLPKISLRFALLPALSILDACLPPSQHVPPQLETYHVVNTMRFVVDSFTHQEGRVPATLLEACAKLTPTYSRPSRCGYWLHHGDTIPLDGWRNPLRYDATGGLVSIRSSGADGQFSTSDDMGFNAEEERIRVREVAGCYRVDFREWKEFPGDVMRLDTTYHAGGAYKAWPEIEPYFTPLWHPSPYPGGRDSIYVIWQAIHHGVHFHFRAYGDSMTGFVFGGRYRRPRLVANRIVCPL